MADDIKNKFNLKIELSQPYLWDIKILLLLALLLFAGLGYLIHNNIISDVLTDLTGLRTEEVQLKQSVSEQYGLIKVLPEYQAKALELNQVESLVNHHFPNGDETPKMLVDISQLAELSGASVVNFLPSSDDKTYNESGINLPNNSKIYIRTFSLNGSSSAEGFVAFLYRLASFPRVIQVNTASIDRVDDSKVNFVMTISIFFVK